ncbi:MAG: 50S ribosomal protein L13 [Patescibacteria group bacterium]|nr:50S ribosomal protein L13 [Patescibacteria group bacterium]MBU2508856.1 50S ribosomal protein L13 [Patescibacteria group bacterium]
MNIERKTHEIDAEGKIVGRLATQIAGLLIGKGKTDYTPNIDGGDFVKVKNADKVVFSGKKWDQKNYYRTSGRPGGLKIISVKKMREEKPNEILRNAVKYMLPKNKTQDVRMKRLIID